ncbi:acetyl-CoA acetyltransferase [Sphingomonas sp. Root710]|uniref:thiolase family protein n=1 Tax=Sphingomonas sp. Root710 TaxID=1736594 RepID=UPI0006F9BB39|nr:acetyl-CoA C-acyltransferase [Sphingomonas sp. Root710]KRB85529.1 acetyl-CoA acetyltransferase [Sphingomonas sp. Root710]
MSKQPVIIDAIRTATGRGKPGGALSSLHPVDLLAGVLEALVSRNGIDPGTVDDVIIGCVTQIGEQTFVPRMAVLGAGFPDHVPATSIDRKCGSSQQAIHFAAHAIAAGACDIVIAGGVETMSRVPIGSNRINKDIAGEKVRKRYAPGLVSQGISAELIAARWGISREEMDEYSALSHARAAAASANGGFDAEIIAVDTENGPFLRDETIRSTTTAEGLAGLNPVFVDPAMSERFPELFWGVTAGNSSQLADAAAAVLLMSEDMAIKLNLRPRARFVAFDVMANDPLLMLTAPIPVTRRVLGKAGLSMADIDHFEVNEAFASVPLAWAKELQADPARLNPRGGAIALGHPLGASGARLMTTMLHALEANGERYGLQTMCENGGMANATIIERL